MYQGSPGERRHDWCNVSLSFLSQGFRPSLTELPADSPAFVEKMINACWNPNRSSRWPANHCYSSLCLHRSKNLTSIDVAISYDPKSASVCTAIFHRLTCAGLTAVFHPSFLNEETDQYNSIMTTSLHEQLPVTKIVLVCLSLGYSNEVCTADLREARATGKVIAVILLDENTESWPSTDLLYLCQLFAPYASTCDLSSIANDTSWHLEDGPDVTVMDSFECTISQMVQKLKSSLS